MADKRPTTIAGYIAAAPKEGQSHLRMIHLILVSVAPKAQQTIKWGNPFFVEPRFLFAFSAHKAHASFAPGPEALEVFHDELKTHKTTKNFLHLPYHEPLPESLIRKIAEYQIKRVSARDDDGFW